jgi:hypothetical protein
MGTPNITDARFWAIIDQARHGRTASADPKALSRVLSPLSDSEVLAFGHMFTEKVCALNFWNLWAAGYIIAQGMSDDSFHYFRSWIIGKGKSVFDVATSNPDGLGPWIDNREVNNESLEYAAVNIMKKRGGPDPRDLSNCEPDAIPGVGRSTKKR